jgi:hypothetical protein
MKLHAAFLVFLPLLLPMAAQASSGQTKTPVAVRSSPSIFSASVQVNSPNGAANGHDAPTALQVKGGRGGDGGVNNVFGGSGGGIVLKAGDGGGSSQDAGTGGNIVLFAGNGGSSSEVGANALQNSSVLRRIRTSIATESTHFGA